ncbi:unnamed protein product [Brassica oleracea var. botrytis]
MTQRVQLGKKYMNSQTTKWAKKCENGLKQQIADWEALEGREPSQLLSVEDYWTKQRNDSGPKKLFLNSKQRKESPRSRCILDNIQGMICDVVFTSKLTDEEAKWIMETAQSFYLNDTRYKLLERSEVIRFDSISQILDRPPQSARW